MSKVSKTFSVTLEDLESIKQISEAENITTSAALRLALRKAKILDVVIEQITNLIKTVKKDDDFTYSIREIVDYAKTEQNIRE